MKAIRVTIGLVLITVGFVATVVSDLEEAAGWLAAGGLGAIGLAGIFATLGLLRSDEL